MTGWSGCDFRKKFSWQPIRADSGVALQKVRDKYPLTHQHLTTVGIELNEDKKQDGK